MHRYYGVRTPMGEEQVRLTLKKYVGYLEERHPLPIGGVADYYVEANTLIELGSAVSGAIAAGLPYLVISTGNRILFSDGGYPGLLIRNMAAGVVRSSERSQIITDSGVPLGRLVTQTAAWELGGLTPFYGQTASLGGALYSDLQVNGHRLAASVRSVTVLMPPTRLSTEAKIVRQSANWLFDAPEPGSRLSRLRESGDGQGPVPILLSATLQLTSNRGGDLMDQIRRSNRLLAEKPRGSVGPLFELPLQGNLDESLQAAGKGLRIGTCSLHRRMPNYAVARGTFSSSDLRRLIETLQERVLTATGSRLTSRYEYLGVW